MNGNEGTAPRIGFYGCRGELVRVTLTPRPERHPRAIDVPCCPACGHEHGAKPFWRKRQAGDDDKAVLVLDYVPPA